MKKILLSVAFMLLVIPAVFSSNDIYGQILSVEECSEKEEKKKEEPKEKSEVKPVQSSGPTLEQELLKDRTSPLRELENRVRERGADAVVGIDIDYDVLGPDGGMLMVTASGTVVKLA